MVKSYPKQVPEKIDVFILIPVNSSHCSFYCFCGQYKINGNYSKFFLAISGEDSLIPLEASSRPRIWGQFPFPEAGWMYSDPVRPGW